MADCRQCYVTVTEPREPLQQRLILSQHTLIQTDRLEHIVRKWFLLYLAVTEVLDALRLHKV